MSEAIDAFLRQRIMLEGIAAHAALFSHRVKNKVKAPAP